MSYKGEYRNKKLSKQIIQDSNTSNRSDEKNSQMHGDIIDSGLLIGLH